MSADFNDLIQRLLVKDPMQRISLPQLLAHSFWDVEFPPLSLPTDSVRASLPASDVDVLRLSKAL